MYQVYAASTLRQPKRPPYLPEGMRRTVCEPGNPLAWNHKSVFTATLWLSLSFSLLLRPISTCGVREPSDAQRRHLQSLAGHKLAKANGLSQQWIVTYVWQKAWQNIVM